MRRLVRAVRLAVWARRFAHLGPSSSLSRRAVIKSPGQISIGSHCSIADGVVLNGKSTERLGIDIGESVTLREYAWLSANDGVIEIGDRTVIGPFVMIYGISRCVIGSDILIGGHSSIVAGNHIFADATRPIAGQGTESIGILIEDDVWIGANCVILDGVTIGRGAVVGAGSVVTRDVAAYTVVCGNPARLVTQRTAMAFGQVSSGGSSNAY